MIGGCRNAGDEQRVAELKAYTAELGLKVGRAESESNYGTAAD